jgi:putative SOS response-associated peptidase YedK
VILSSDPGTIQFLRWGLRPAWLQEMGKRKGLINVRAETLREKPTFTRNLAKRRCVVLADSFYVWKTGVGQKIPYRVSLVSGEPFALAGIWEQNRDEEGKPVQTFAIVTTTVNELVQSVHSRMAVIVRREAERHWLDSQASTEHLLSLLRPYPGALMRMEEVSMRVNRTTGEAADIPTPLQEGSRKTPFSAIKK